MNTKILTIFCVALYKNSAGITNICYVELPPKYQKGRARAAAEPHIRDLFVNFDIRLKKRVL